MNRMLAVLLTAKFGKLLHFVSIFIAPEARPMPLHSIHVTECYRKIISKPNIFGSGIVFRFIIFASVFSPEKQFCSLFHSSVMLSYRVNSSHSYLDSNPGQIFRCYGLCPVIFCLIYTALVLALFIYVLSFRTRKTKLTGTRNFFRF